MYILLWLSAVLVLLAAWIFRRFIYHGMYILSVLIDVAKDLACQFWIDLGRLWKWFRGLFKRKTWVDLDPDEEFWRE
jgi:hypothetical protein